MYMSADINKVENIYSVINMSYNKTLKLPDKAWVAWEIMRS